MLKNDPSGWDSFIGRIYWFYLIASSLYPPKRRCEKVLSTLRLNNDAKIIEMGVGTGYYLRSFKKRGFKSLYGLDYSHNILKRLRGTSINPVHGDVRDLKLESHSFDLVFSDGLVEHFQDPLPILLNLGHVAKKYLVTIVPRKTLFNKIQTLFLRPPKEYNRLDEEWVQMHKKLGFDKIDWHILGPSSLIIICSRI